MHEHLAGFTDTDGVVFIGRASGEDVAVSHRERRDSNGDAHPWIVKTPVW